MVVQNVVNSFTQYHYMNNLQTELEGRFIKI